MFADLKDIGRDTEGEEVSDVVERLFVEDLLSITATALYTRPAMLPAEGCA